MASIDNTGRCLDVPKSWNAFYRLNTLNMVHSLAVMVLVLYGRYPDGGICSLPHLVRAMHSRKIYSSKHSIHLMRRALINDTLYGGKALS